MTKLPPYLHAGDKILLIATARSVSEADMLPALHQLRSWGFEIETGPHLYSKYNQFAGTDDERCSDLQWALDHPQAKAIIIARGGYGTMRIIDRISFKGYKKYPKWVAGYSDITALHNSLYNQGFCSIHGTMPVNFTRNEIATLSLKNVLCGEKVLYQINTHPLNRSGKAEAEIVGGNLSLLYALNGSSSAIDLSGKILFIEDLDEYLYHIDRMMLSLRRAGKLKKLAALVVGGMSDMRDNDIPFGETALEIIRRNVEEFDFPVCFNFPAGHIDNNRAFYHGRKCVLRVTESDVEFTYP